MLSLEGLKEFYPPFLQQQERFILREYLQYKILEIIFESPFGNKLSFLGGTCLRIVYNNQRFSEDLDFDNFNLTQDDFDTFSKIVKTELNRLGLEVEIRNVFKGAFHCYIRFPGILFRQGLTKHQEEKILIRIDTEAHDFTYPPNLPLLNKFDVFARINSTPADILLSQKFYAVLNRKRNKGRDFFDIVFLLGLGKGINYDYLDFKTGINGPESLRQSIINKCTQLNMQEMAKDVGPFLFHKKDEKKVLLFQDYIQHVGLN